MKETLFDLFSEFRRLVWEDELDLSKIREVVSGMALLLFRGKESKLLDQIFSEPSRESLAITFLKQIRQHAVIHTQSRTWEQARELSVPELESVLQAVKHITDDAYLRLDGEGKTPNWIREPVSFEISMLLAQLGSIETMLLYRVSRQLYSGTVPEWDKLDFETQRQLARAVRGKASDEQRRSTVMKVHENIKSKMKATEAITKAMEWLHDEHGIFIEDPKTIRRWAKKLRREWWEPSRT